MHVDALPDRARRIAAGVVDVGLNLLPFVPAGALYASGYDVAAGLAALAVFMIPVAAGTLRDRGIISSDFGGGKDVVDGVVSQTLPPDEHDHYALPDNLRERAEGHTICQVQLRDVSWLRSRLSGVILLAPLVHVPVTTVLLEGDADVAEGDEITVPVSRATLETEVGAYVAEVSD